ncbi:uncharacterized protein [Nicotiana tomentosiformis]|uniref:uncharacterized protein n=1 Tax=Nicotiana tomentosiformis TaxID=4098 RepID=UPI00388CB091
MDDNNDCGWMERFVAVATNDIIPTTAPSFLVAWNRTRLPAGSVVVPGEDILANPTDAARLLQESLTRTGISEPVSGANISLRSPRTKDKQTKRGHSSAAGEKNKRAKVDAPESSPMDGSPYGPVVDTMLIDDEEEAVDEGASLHRRRRSSSSQQDAQFVEIVTPTEDDISALWGDTAFDATASFSSTPSASSPPSPTPATASLFPSSSTLSPAVATPSPSTAPNHEEGVPLPQSPIHGNLRQNYVAPSEDPQRRRNITFSVSIGCNLLSRPVELTNYLKPLASEKDWEKIQTLSGECLLNNAMHNATAANFLTSEGLQRLIREKEELTFERDQLLAERDQTVLRLSELETRATEADVLKDRLQQNEQEVVNLNQEIGPLRVNFDEAKANWAEVQNVIFAATVREATCAERVINLEAGLNSKSEDLAVVEVKYAQLKEKYMKTIDHNRLFSSTVRALDVGLKSTRSTRENLSAEVIQLKEELKRRAASLIIEKTYSMYSMRRKTLEEAKAGIIGVDAEIAKARELQLAA